MEGITGEDLVVGQGTLKGIEHGRRAKCSQNRNHQDQGSDQKRENSFLSRLLHFVFSGAAENIDKKKRRQEQRLVLDRAAYCEEEEGKSGLSPLKKKECANSKGREVNVQIARTDTGENETQFECRTQNDVARKVKKDRHGA